ncbi:MAG: hypothetical protein GF365_01925 [Candidatus Buchananbacteria bacterium]|nr:hypothetical protein [Candidatus Buchananbacteria bacterium]
MRFQLVKLKILLLLVILIITSAFVLPQKSFAQHDNYPKLANYYLEWYIEDSSIKELAKWDVVILSPQAVENNPQIITKLKQYNPQIKILVYVLAEEINVNQDILNKTAFWQKIYNEVNQNNWWLRTNDNQHVTFWPGTWMINTSSVAPKSNGQNWSDYLPKLVYDEFLKSGQWDGVFYDNVWNGVSWMDQPIDTDKNGSVDSKNFMDSNWQKGLTNILKKTRQLAPNKLIVANSNDNIYNSHLNGRMQENFPAYYEGHWQGAMERYLNDKLGYEPKYFIINNNTANTGNSEDYRDFRFGLTSTLLGDGYYSFDHGDKAHESLWWYDEYNFYLGRSLNDIENLLSAGSKQIQPGVWQRDFQNGLVLVNSTGVEQEINFNKEFEKIKGNQDPITNNGAIVRSVTLKPYDGIILLRRVEEVTGSSYFNGSFVRVFNKYGDSVRNGFFLYEKQFKGGNVVVKKDINKDNQIETLVADKNKIIIYKPNKSVMKTFYPYGQNYNYGINFSLNDYEDDGFYEITTGTMKGYGPEIRVFNHLGEQQGEGFNAYQAEYKGGVNVAVCDTNGNGKKEIVTGAGYMGGPLVRIFDKNGKVLSGGFFAYNKSFRGGVNVACGDIDGNGVDEIVTGAGYGGSSHVRYFNSKFEPLSPGFWAFGKDSRTGVRVVINDLDNDGAAEILAASPDTFTTAFKNW